MQPMEHDGMERERKAAMERYFTAAREWYGVVYHYPITDRALYTVMCLVALLTLLVAGIVLYDLFPLNKKRPIIVYSGDVFGETSGVSRLAGPQEDYNLAIIRHILPGYVKMREHYEYDVEKLEEGFSVIRHQSSRQVFEAYQSYMNPKNRASPLTRYGKSIKRQVTIGDHSVNLEQKPYTARVWFEARIDDGRRVHKNKYVADIAFRFSKIQVDQRTGVVFKESMVTGKRVEVGGKVDFQVTKYKVSEQAAGD